MSRDIYAIPPSGSGDAITVPFPDLARPQNGTWNLSVTLHDDAGGGAKARIRLVQTDEAKSESVVLREEHETRVAPVDRFDLPG